MQIVLCKKSLMRLPGTGGDLVEALREGEHSIIIKDCLDRCQRCDLGLIIASADGMPLAAKDASALLSDVEALAD